jgi:MoaA/NifB/PqqE/SkfB family radical SAM enzyme
MRILRSLVNACLRPLAAQPSPEIRDLDRRILRGLAGAGSMLRIPQAERLGEPWMLDCLRVLAGGIAASGYGAELRRPYPLVISVSTANSCALGCSFCYSSSTAAPAGNSAMTADLAEKIAASPVPIAFLTGGEPFHHPRLTELLGPILDSGKKILIATNAPSVRVATALLTHRQQITILLSQWGEQERHDSVRGRGNYERTAAAAQRLAALGHRVALNYVLSPATVAADFEDLERVLASSPHLHRIYLSRELRVGRVPRADRRDLDPAELRREVLTLSGKFPGRLTPMIPELVPAQGLPARNKLTRLLGIRLPASCGAAAWTMHADSAGDCYPCFAHEGRLPLGNLLTDDLVVVWQRAQELRQASPASPAATSATVRSACWAENASELLTIGPARLRGDA